MLHTAHNSIFFFVNAISMTDLKLEYLVLPNKLCSGEINRPGANIKIRKKVKIHLDKLLYNCLSFHLIGVLGFWGTMWRALLVRTA